MKKIRIIKNIKFQEMTPTLDSAALLKFSLNDNIVMIGETKKLWSMNMAIVTGMPVCIT